MTIVEKAVNINKTVHYRGGFRPSTWVYNNNKNDKNKAGSLGGRVSPWRGSGTALQVAQQHT